MIGAPGGTQIPMGPLQSIINIIDFDLINPQVKRNNVMSTNSPSSSETATLTGWRATLPKDFVSGLVVALVA